MDIHNFPLKLTIFNNSVLFLYVDDGSLYFLKIINTKDILHYVECTLKTKLYNDNVDKLYCLIVLFPKFSCVDKLTVLFKVLIKSV